MGNERLYKTEVKEVAESLSKNERSELVEKVITLVREESNNSELGKQVDLLVKNIVGKG
jgi:hypothetical protein